MLSSTSLPSTDEKISCCYFKKLPIIIFPLIEIYLNSDDYTRLMTSSQSLFKDVKRHTFVISLSEFDLKRESINESKDKLDENIELRFEQFYCVRKQFEKDLNLKNLKLFISDVPENILMKCTYSYARIYHLCVKSSPGVSSDFDFSVFNDINTVKLDSFPLVKNISKGLKNIRNLSIINFSNLVSIDCSLVGLDSLSICSCKELKFIKSLENIKKIHLQHCEQLIPDLSKTNGSLQRFSFCTIPNKFRLNMIPSQSLQYLQISDFIPHPRDDFDLFIHIPHLIVKADSLAFPEFPHFYGKHLFLENCMLFNWVKGIRFENLRSLSLHDCSDCYDLPIFPNLRRLELNSIHDLMEIDSESLPQCRRLTVSNCSDIRVIYWLPKVEIIEVAFCTNFQELIGFRHGINQVALKTVEFTGLDNFSKMSCLRDVAEIKIVNYQGVALDFNGFDQSNLPKEKRKLVLDCCEIPTNCKGLGNLGLLQINRGHGLGEDDGQGIHDIDHLIVRNISNLTYLSACRDLKQVDIHQPCFLKSLDGLQNIPIVSLFFTSDSCGNINPEGLQGCGQVYCHESLLVAHEAQKYVNERLSTVFTETFDSIKEFYVVRFRNDNNFTRWEDFVRDRTRLW